MGSLYSANCPCGYTKSVRVGAGRRDHQTNSVFPFYCATCGMVEANISIGQPCCPYCKSAEVIPYGDPKISSPATKHKGVQWGSYSCSNDGNICPECKEKSLKFSLEMLFD